MKLLLLEEYEPIKSVIEEYFSMKKYFVCNSSLEDSELCMTSSDEPAGFIYSTKDLEEAIHIVKFDVNLDGIIMGDFLRDPLATDPLKFLKANGEGFAFLTILRKVLKNDVPVATMVGTNFFANHDIKTSYKQAGVDYFLEKPCKLKDYDDLLKKFKERKNSR